MADWGVNEGSQTLVTIGATTASSVGTVIASPGSINTKGAYTQIVASTSSDAAGLLIGGSIVGAASLNTLIDIAVGAGGSEVVVIPDVSCIRISSTPMAIPQFYVPLAIPAGTRISARIASSDTSAIATLSVQIVTSTANLPQSCGTCEAWGVTAASSRGVTVDPGGTANTKGAYTQLTAGSSFKVNYLVVGFMPDPANNNQGFNYLVDIAVGSGGSEQVIVSNIHIYAASNIGTGQARLTLPVSIPAGSRVAVRAQCSSNTVNVRNLVVNIQALG
jgi:hypothetical protein